MDQSNEVLERTLADFNRRLADLERSVAELKSERSPQTSTAAAEVAAPSLPASRLEGVDEQAQATNDVAVDAALTQTSRSPAAANEVVVTVESVPVVLPKTEKEDVRRQRRHKPEQADGPPIGTAAIVGVLAWIFSGYFLAGAVFAAIILGGWAIFFRKPSPAGATAGATASGASPDAAADGAASRTQVAPDGDVGHAPLPSGPSRPWAFGSKIEQAIGRYWYLWTGVFALVIGLGYGLILAYQHVGPVVKIASWFLGAGVLVGAGELALRRMKQQSFGQALIAGGYALAFFTVYAMQNVASVKVMDNVVLDSSLLLALAAGCMTHALARRSETIALLSALLAFVTISLSPVTYFTVVASAVMVVALASVTVAMRWYKVYLAAAVGSYATFMLFTQPQIALSVEPSQALFLSQAFLAAYWLVYNLVALFLKEAEGDRVARGYVVGVGVINAGSFVLLGLLAMWSQFADWRYLLLLITGVAYFAWSALARVRRMRATSALFALVALNLLTAAVPLWLDPRAVSAVWLLEIPLLIVAGLKFRLWTFRAFACGLALVGGARLVVFDMLDPHSVAVFGLTLSCPVLIGLVGVFAFALASVAYSLRSLADSRHEIEERAAQHLYFAEAAMVAWLIPAVAASRAVQGFYWALEAAIILFLWHQRGYRLAEVLGIAAFATSAVSLSISYSQLTPLVACLSVGFFYGASALYRWRPGAGGKEEQYHFHHGFAVAAMLLTWALTLLNHVSDPGSGSLWLTLESALLVGGGFLLRDGAWRQFAGFGFAVAAVAFLFAVDSWTWLSALPVVAALFAYSFVYRYAPLKHRGQQASFLDAIFSGAYERRTWRFAYAAAAMLLLFGVTGVLANNGTALCWALEASCVVVLGFVLGDKEWRTFGALGFVPALAALLFTIDAWSWAVSLPIAALLFAAGFAFRWLPLLDMLGDDGLLVPVLSAVDERKLMPQVSTVAGAVVMTAAFFLLLQWQWLAVAWSLEAIVMLAIGVALPDKTYRYCAHAVFALMLGKLVLWDLRNADSVVRVISWVVAGVVLIGAAYIFNRFEKKLEGESERSRQASD